MKTLWRVLAVLALVGAIFMTIGFAVGANNHGFYFDEHGLHMFNYTEAMIKEEDIGVISEIDIDSQSCDIRFVKAETYGFEINSRKENAFTYSVADGKLLIKEKRSFNFFLFNFGWQPERLIIYLPESAYLDFVSLRNVSGDINIDQLHTKDLYINQTSGDIKITKLTADDVSVISISGDMKINEIVADKCTLNTTSGDVRVSNAASKQLRIKVVSGTTEVNGELGYITEINTTTGDIKLEINGAEQDYNRQIRTVTGDVIVNGNRNNAGSVDFKATKSLDITVVTGDVRINFLR